MLTVVTSRRSEKGYVTLVLYGLAALAILTIVTAVVVSYNNAIKTAERLTSENSRLQQDNSDLQAENYQVREREKRSQILLAARQAERNAAQKEARNLLGALENARTSSKETKDWSDAPIPSSVIDSLRNQPDKDKDNERENPATTKPVSTDKRSLVERIKIGK